MIEILSELEPVASGVRARVPSQARGVVPTRDFIGAPVVVSGVSTDSFGDRATVRRAVGITPSLSTLREQRTIFEAAVAAAHPDGVPDWVAAALQALSSALAKVESIETQRRGDLRDVAVRERWALGRRAELGDALAQSVAALDAVSATEVAAAEALLRARSREASAVVAVTLAWSDLGPPTTEPPVIDETRADAMELLGLRAADWSAAHNDAVVVGARSEAVAKDRVVAEEAVRVGRIAAAELEDECLRLDDEHRAKAGRMGRDIDELYRFVTDHAESLAGHLQAFPAARAVLAWRSKPMPRASGTDG